MTEAVLTSGSAMTAGEPREAVYRHRLATRIWHWVNALTIFVMLMSGMMIFNAHPQLYWGQYGADDDHSWLEIGSNDEHGFLRIGSLTVPTTGVLGYAQGQDVAFPPLVTIPTSYDLAAGRSWHFFFAWFLVIPTLVYWVWSVLTRHLQRDLAPKAEELRPRHLLRDIANHARLRFPTGEAARRYNVLQKLAYLSVLFVLLPLMVLTGLAMSPGVNAGWPWLLDVFGGRQSARSIHFICASGLAGFIVIHLTMVLLAGPWNEVRSMVTGFYRLPGKASR
ncbi:cytochrome b/b6 domain-containing protein [Lichenifustis flavocetrariae]|uniref:Cytochrome b/b6 domain-containing protein n=1 Tax=Lichenifustis flavocetrariae TaxID=2949735 RepID=A0AA42CS76_9HYPH|nr:cytochrome b/b6 domain-containing protein [Lichenifustis flavocetrariae]MCW6513247.1 cytochrome b/b6 domain-containing protein [Lichenifustis flavocetrariae]